MIIKKLVQRPALCAALFFIISILSQSQSLANGSGTDTVANSRFNMGVGFGVDYGGLGFRLTFIPDKHVGIFLAGGTNFIDATYGFGADFRILPASRACPFIGLMYGYNAFIHITDASEYDKTYYGISMPFGVELHSRKNKNNYWNFELIIPFRSDTFQKDYDAIKANPAIEMKNSPSPVLFAVGYHFAII